MSPVHVVLRPGRSQQAHLAPLGALLDLVVDGVNLTARAGETQGLTLLAELAQAAAALRKGRTARATAQLCTEGDTWELGLEADGEDALLSVFRSGPCPEVAVHERRVRLVDLEEALEAALTTALSGNLPAGHRSVLESARSQLERGAQRAKPLPRNLVQDRVLIRTTSGLEMQANASFRTAEAPQTEHGASVERADLHALLVPGRFQVALGRRSITVARAHLFLLAERLLWLAEDALESFQAARPLFRRLQVEGLRVGVRRGPGDGPVAFTVATTGDAGEKTLTLSELDTADFVEAVSLFAEALGERFVEHDARQAQNLRLGVLRESARILRDRLAELRLDDGVTNREPDSYKSYGLPIVTPKSEGTWSEAGSMRFVPRWVAAVPHVDLRATFLYEDRLIVGSAREVASLIPTTGEIAWRIHSDKAATVATPVGLARLHADGRLRVHDLANGEVRSVTRLMPRAGGGAAGALVNSPGLPRMLLVAEGDRAITAVDLATGDVRWRHKASRPSGFRLRRAGRLVLVSGGDSALSALDVTTGEVVWRVRDRLPFNGDIAVSGDSAFALSASPVGAARLHHIHLWSGETLWTAYLDEQPVAGQAPLLAGDTVTVATRDRRGVGAMSFDVVTGAPRWDHEPGLTAASSAWLPL
ncbi:MAG TPA: PQQ-binding-like beta-propeller repeat protein, partial [Polyangiaceae bacterium]|nr:PQQ-binding-like beta-propeller repeat protein [Polyangiaceae bacterium]